MTIDDQIKDEKIQCDINREAAKISALSSGKIDQYEYLTHSVLPPFLQGGPEKFSMLASRGGLARFEFLGGGVSRKGVVNFFRGV